MKLSAEIKEGIINIEFSFSQSKDFLKMVAFMRELPNRLFNARYKRWEVPYSPQVAQALKSKGFPIEIPKEVEEKKLVFNPNFEVPGLKKELKPFQKKGVHFLEMQKGRALIADEMGLGKTLQAISYLQLHPELRPAIVVCPASAKFVWQKEFRESCGIEDLEILAGRQNSEEIKSNIVIVNYDILKDRLAELQELSPAIIVLDESHNIKNVSALRTKAVNTLCQGVPHVVCLSGTPITNRPIEFFSTLNLLAPHQFPNRFKFALRYCNAKKNRFGWDMTGASNTEELNRILTKNIMIRHKKSEVLTELPPKTRTAVSLEIDNKKEYKKIEEDVLGWICQNEGAVAAAKASRAEYIVRLEKLKQTAAEGKLKAIIKWIEDFLDSDEKLIVFCSHTSIIDSLHESYKDISVKFDGSTPNSERGEIVKKFQEDKNCKLFLGNIKAAGEAITLTAASNVAFAEFDWTPGRHLQAEDRCIFQGQKVLTREGYTPIENIKIGDIVLTHIGNWNPVLKINSKLERKKLQINIKYFGFNENLTCTEDHPIFVYNNETQKYEWENAINLRPKIHCLTLNPGKTNIQKFKSLTLQKPFQKLFINNFGKEQSNGRMHAIPNKVKINDRLLYALGFYVANGHGRYNKNPSFISVCGDAKKKKGIVKKVASTFSKAFGNLPINYYTNKQNCFSATIYSKNLAFNFLSWFGKKSANKQFPDWVFSLNRKQIKNLLSGFFAGDGYKRKNTQQGCTVSPKLISQLVILNAKIKRTIMGVGFQEKSKVWTIEYSIKSKIKRSTKIKVHSNGNILFPISEVNISLPKKGKDRVYDLTVAADHSFVVGLSSVHNCHRIGQKDAVTAYYLVAQNTIEEKLVELLNSKAKVLEEILDGKEKEESSVFAEVLNDFLNKKGKKNE